MRHRAARRSLHPLALTISAMLLGGGLSGSVHAAAFPAAIDLGALSGSNGFRLDGVEPGNYAGYSVSAAGDINGDGIDDLIVSAPNSDQDPSIDLYTGTSYVVFGRGGGFAASQSLDTLDGTDGFRIDGTSERDFAGTSVSGAGDVNGDGFDDLIIGARGTATNGPYSGSAYVLFGGATFASAVALSALNGSNGLRIDGAATQDFAGVSVSDAGDINGDGIDDVIVGASRADPGGIGEAGSSYVIFGRNTAFAATLDVSSLNGNNGFRLDGEAAVDLAGGSVSGAGDFNGDGIDDLIIGAFRAESSYIVFGKATPFSATVALTSLDGSNGIRLDGVAGERSGYSVSGAGDINGDGLDDVIVGAPYAQSTGVQSGSGYLVFGQPSPLNATLALSSLDGSNGVRFDGLARENAGTSVSAAGDVNADGFDDLIIGANEASRNGRSLSGSSYLVFGHGGGFAATVALSSLNGTTGVRFDGATLLDRSGSSVSALGDINSDGIDDVIIGALNADPVGFDAGSAYVVFGRLAQDLAISKTDGLANAVPGTPVTYTIAASNEGSTPVSGATVADPFPPELNNCLWTCQPSAGASCGTSGSGNISDIVDLPVGAMVTYTATCDIDPTALGSVANTATVTMPSGVIDTSPSNNSATDSDTLNPTADLSISKDDGVSIAVPGESVSYEIVVSNLTGPSATAATVSDSFPAACSSVSWICSGTGGGTCSASGTGDIADAVNLPVGASVTYTALCGIDPTASGSLDNGATVSVAAGTTDPDPGNNSATDSDTLNPTADLSISKDDGVSIAVPGESVNYQIVASNLTGPSATTATVSDSFPATCSSVSWACSGTGGGTCSASGTGDIADPISLPVGASVTYTALCGIDPTASGSLDNGATVSVAVGTTDPVPGNNSAADSDTLNPTADLSISKDDGVSIAVPGESVSYQIVASNLTGPSATTATVSDSFPAACNSVSWTCSGTGGGTCSASGTGDIADSVGLPVGASVTYSAQCGIDPTAGGTLDNSATVGAAAGTTDPDPGNNSATDSDTLNPTADLSISKDDGVSIAVPGESVNYQIVASNLAGPSATTATVSDSFPAACSSVSWTCSGTGGGTCSASGTGDIADPISLPVGASVTYSAQCDIDAGAVAH